MPIISSTDRGTFEDAVRLARFPSEEFVLTETPTPVALSMPVDLGAGWVTVRRGLHARTYSAGPQYDWISWFKRDLEFGVFGEP